jgi:hypothetical protein
MTEIYFTWEIMYYFEAWSSPFQAYHTGNSSCGQVSYLLTNPNPAPFTTNI